MSNFFFKENSFYCEDVNIKDIAKKYGTPTYIYSKKTLEENINNYKNAFSKKESLICFSVKSLSNLSILELLQDNDFGFDIVSGGELERVIAAGGDPRKTIFTGIAKSEEEILNGIKRNILSFNIESESEMKRIENIASKENKTVDVAIRFNPEVDSGGHEYIKTGRKKDKFGIFLDQIIKLVEHISNSKHLNLIGLSCHIGSQIIDLDDYKITARYVKKLAEEIDKFGINLEFLDLGGGLGISYSNLETPMPNELAAIIEQELESRNEKIILEPGRSISGNAGILITKVEYIKDKYLIVDSGMNDLLRPALYQAKHDICNIEKNTAESTEWTIVGPICESSDVLAKDFKMSVREGDILAIKTTGAYGHVMSSNYNTRRRPPEILVDKDNYKVIRKRESYEDLFKNEIEIEN
tara:strand:- start:271 stop:1506 length:1236 start_codon:yes stop_codon:yes gene_type:complete